MAPEARVHTECAILFRPLLFETSLLVVQAIDVGQLTTHPPPTTHPLKGLVSDCRVPVWGGASQIQRCWHSITRVEANCTSPGAGSCRLHGRPYAHFEDMNKVAKDRIRIELAMQCGRNATYVAAAYTIRVHNGWQGGVSVKSAFGDKAEKVP